jgi:hypothetical protein
MISAAYRNKGIEEKRRQHELYLEIIKLLEGQCAKIAPPVIMNMHFVSSV